MRLARGPQPVGDMSLPEEDNGFSIMMTAPIANNEHHCMPRM